MSEEIELADIEHAMNHSDKPCPKCGTYGMFKVTEEFSIRPLGTHSLSGTQMKTSATRAITATCTSCQTRYVISAVRTVDEP